MYHYTKSKIGINHILKDQLLRFNFLNKLDEPREAMIFKNRATFFGQGTPPGQWNDILKYIKKNIDSIQIACFCSDDFILNGINSNSIKERILNHNDSFYKKLFLPFKGGAEKERMWDQYAKKYEGICLVFNKNELLKTFKDSVSNDSFHKNVNYVNNYMASFQAFNLNNSVKIEGDKYLDHMIFTKPQDYQDENEYRIAVKVHTNDYFSLEIRNSLSAVIFGPKFDQEEYDVYKRLINNSFSTEIRLLQYVIDGGNSISDYYIIEF